MLRIRLYEVVVLCHFFLLNSKLSSGWCINRYKCQVIPRYCTEYTTRLYSSNNRDGSRLAHIISSVPSTPNMKNYTINDIVKHTQELLRQKGSPQGNSTQLYEIIAKRMKSTQNRTSNTQQSREAPFISDYDLAQQNLNADGSLRSPANTQTASQSNQQQQQHQHQQQQQQRRRKSFETKAPSITARRPPTSVELESYYDPSADDIDTLFKIAQQKQENADVKADNLHQQVFSQEREYYNMKSRLDNGEEVEDSNNLFSSVEEEWLDPRAEAILSLEAQLDDFEKETQHDLTTRADGYCTQCNYPMLQPDIDFCKNFAHRFSYLKPPVCLACLRSEQLYRSRVSEAEHNAYYSKFSGTVWTKPTLSPLGKKVYSSRSKVHDYIPPPRRKPAGDDVRAPINNFDRPDNRNSDISRGNNAAQTTPNRNESDTIRQPLQRPRLPNNGPDSRTVENLKSQIKQLENELNRLSRNESNE